MSNKILSFILFIISLLLMTFCSKQIDQDSCVVDSLRSIPSVTKSNLMQNGVWDEKLQMHLVPCEDIYALHNFQNAYDKIANGLSNITLSVEEQSQFKPGTKLSPTHRALHIRPIDEAQQRSIERNKLLSVRYMPFGMEGINSSTIRTSDYLLDSIEPECAIDTETTGQVDVADLYVYWPEDLDIPDSLDYEEEYSVFIPRFSTSLSQKSLFLLENEVLMQKGISVEGRQFNDRSGSKYCCLLVRDTLLQEYVPVPGAKIMVQPGIHIADTTDENGYFWIPSSITYGSVYAVLQTDNWSVCNNTYTSPKTINLGTVSSFKNSNEDVVTVRLSSTPELAVQRAAYYFYNGSHDFSNWNPLDYDPIRIAVMDTLTVGGRFKCYDNPPYIQVKPKPYHPTVFFNTLHEIGHYAHYCRLGRNTFNSRWGGSEWYKLIVESFASYASWYVGRFYYVLNGYEQTYPYDSFTNQDRQDWIYTSTGTSSRYSPFFVDIFDSYNQSSDNPSYLNDTFGSSFLASIIIRNIIENCNTFDSVSLKLHEYDYLFGSSTLDNYLWYYNYWNNNNPNN